MEKEIAGKVTVEERDQIQAYFDRKNALLELIPVLSGEKIPVDALLYEKAVNDLALTKGKMDAWWQQMAEKYKWQGAAGGIWNIHFATREIELLKKDAGAIPQCH